MGQYLTVKYILEMVYHHTHVLHRNSLNTLKIHSEETNNSWMKNYKTSMVTYGSLPNAIVKEALSNGTCGRKSVKSITALSSNGLAPPQKVFCKQKWLDENGAKHFLGNEKGSSETDSLDFSYLDNTSGGIGFWRIHLFMFH
jgi:hypothetical protein